MNIDKDYYLAGNRQIGWFSMALSIAATWIWAPALFVSAEQAYTNGIPGVFWFLVPNIACLLIFIPFAKRIREKMPNGFTLSELMGVKYSPRVKKLYVFQLSALALLSTVVQLLAGGKILSAVTGTPFWLMTLFLGLFAYAYSAGRGIRASVFTDAFKMAIMLGACILFVPWAIKTNGFETVIKGLGGISGEFKGLFDAKGIEVMLAFGIPTTIGLLSGPFGDQNFWQRAFSVHEKQITKAFVWGAVAFAVVPLMMAVLGFVAAGTGFIASDQSVVNLELVTSLFPSWAVWVFMLMLLCGLLSTVDSNLCSFSSLMNDVRESYDIKDYKKGMLGLVIVSVFIANIPGLAIVHLFLFYGIMRAVTVMPTVLTLLNINLSEKGAFYGVLASLVIGWPIFVYGNLFDITHLKVTGSVLALTLSGAVALMVTHLGGKKSC